MLDGYDHFLDCIDLRYNEEELYIKSIRNYPKFERKNFRTFFFTQWLLIGYQTMS